MVLGTCREQQHQRHGCRRLYITQEGKTKLDAVLVRHAGSHVGAPLFHTMHAQPRAATVVGQDVERHIARQTDAFVEPCRQRT